MDSLATHKQVKPR